MLVQESGEFSIEAWVVPGERHAGRCRASSATRPARRQRNFTLQQTLYDYDFQLRTNETSLNGDPALSTPAADEVLQATLQHVVATYSPIDGRRKIYVNGDLVTQRRPGTGRHASIDWQDNFALILGNEASGEGQSGRARFRLAAIHRRA